MRKNEYSIPKNNQLEHKQNFIKSPEKYQGIQKKPIKVKGKGYINPFNQNHIHFFFRHFSESEYEEMFKKYSQDKLYFDSFCLLQLRQIQGNRFYNKIKLIQQLKKIFYNKQKQRINQQNLTKINSKAEPYSRIANKQKQKKSINNNQQQMGQCQCLEEKQSKKQKQNETELNKQQYTISHYTNNSITNKNQQNTDQQKQQSQQQQAEALDQHKKIIEETQVKSNQSNNNQQASDSPWQSVNIKQQNINQQEMGSCYQKICEDKDKNTEQELIIIPNTPHDKKKQIADINQNEEEKSIEKQEKQEKYEDQKKTDKKEEDIQNPSDDQKQLSEKEEESQQENKQQHDQQFEQQVTLPNTNGLPYFFDLTKSWKYAEGNIRDDKWEGRVIFYDENNSLLDEVLFKEGIVQEIIQN